MIGQRIYWIALLGFTITFGCGIGEEQEKQVGRKKFPSVKEADLQGVVRTNLDSPDPTEAQLKRKAKSIDKVKKLGLPYIDHLPVVEDETQIKPRSSEEVAKRCIAIIMCAVKGESQGKDEPFVRELVEEYGAEAYFSPEEATFINDESPEEQDFVNFAWRYECAHVLLWALGHHEELTPPNVITDVPSDVKILREAGTKDFVGKAKLRSQTEILDMADLYYRLHWAAIELRIKGEDSVKIDEEIIQERHRALNWLIRYMDQKWDDVTTDT